MKSSKASNLEVAESSWQNIARTHPSVRRTEARMKSTKAINLEVAAAGKTLLARAQACGEQRRE